MVLGFDLKSIFILYSHYVTPFACCHGFESCEFFFKKKKVDAIKEKTLSLSDSIQLSYHVLTSNNQPHVLTATQLGFGGCLASFFVYQPNLY
jgi:hypothetical protein